MGILRPTGLAEDVLALGLSLCEQGIYEINLQARSAHFSDTWYELFGAATGARIDSLAEWTALVHPDDQDDTQALLREYLADPTIGFRREHRLRKPNGDYQWILSRWKVAEFSDADQPTRLVGVDQKCDEKCDPKHHTEESAGVPQVTMAQVAMDGAGVGIMLVQESGRLVYANQAAANCVGVERQELTQLRLSDFLGDYQQSNDPLSWNALWTTATQSQSQPAEQLAVDARLTPISGEVIKVVVRASPTRSNGTQLLCLIVDEMAINQESVSHYQQLESTTRRLLDTLPAYIWEKDTNNRILRVNRTAALASGKEPREIAGRPTEEVYPNQAAAYYKVDRQVIETGEAVHGLIEELEDGKGGVRWMSIDKLPLKDGSGKVEGLLVVATDVTELKESQQQLELSERRFRSLAQHIDQVLWIRSPDGSQTHYVSPAFSHLWQINPDDVLADSSSWLANCDAEDRKRVSSAFLAKACLGTYDETYRITRADGTVCWIRDRGFPIHDAAGLITQITGFAIDVTAEREESLAKERDLSKANSFVRTLRASLAEASLESLAQVATEELRLLVNSETSILRLEPSATGSVSVVNSSSASAVSGQETPHYLEEAFQSMALLKALKKTTVPLQLSYADFRKYANRITEEPSSEEESQCCGAWIGVPLVASESTVIGYLAAFRPDAADFPDSCAETMQQYGVVLTLAIERLCAEHQLISSKRELEESNRNLDRFTYVASHDLKAPLRAINNLTTWLSEDLGDELSEASARHIATLQNRVKRMEKMLDDLLNYSRIGRSTVETKEVDVEQLVRGAFEFVTANEAFSLHTRDLPTLTTVSQPLELCFRNLIDNAIKHHDQDRGSLTVTAEDQGYHYRFAVTDDGPGIAAEFHERIFGMFQSLKPRDVVEGSGIGLAMLKRTVEHYGGKLWLESAPDAGSTFHFLWPKQIRKRS